VKNALFCHFPKENRDFAPFSPKNERFSIIFYEKS
jgi:hypothetical protein